MKIVFTTFLLGAWITLPLLAQIDPTDFAHMKARSIGPAGMSGRVAAVEVVPGDPMTLYVGAATGGVWKSADGGITWHPIFDGESTSSIGAIAVSPTNPDVVWVGTGEGNPRNSAGVGRGMFKSVDGGRSWRFLGLGASERIHRVVLHPTDPNIAYAAALGPSWSDGEERGVYRTRDGGTTWERVLFSNPRTGASDLVMDTRNPDKLYAGMWEHRRWPWFFESGGEGSGVFVTHDGGDRWTRSTADDGMPEGPLGRIGLAVGVNEPDVVYALVEAERSALLRSDDGGITWRTIRSGPGTAPRPFYYADIRVDPTNENRVYNLHSRIEVSEDQGRTSRLVVPSQKIHGDVQDLWIGATGRFLVMGNDGGIGISHDRGATWRFVENLPLAQFYHINVDLDRPYHVYGGLQDNGSWFGPSSVWRDGVIRNYDWTRVGGGDGFATLNDFGNPRYGFTQSQQGNIRRFDKVTGERKDVKPVHPAGLRLRFNWNAAANVDPFDSTVIYLGSQFVHRTRDHGNSWEIISPDLTTNDSAKQRAHESGGITRDASGAENHTTIVTIAPSPLERGVIWVGTDDGNVHVTRDGGASWVNVIDRVRGVPEHTWVPHIEPSKFAGGSAFVAFDDHRRGNWETYLFRADDYGRSWTNLAADDLEGFVHVVEQDHLEPNLLFAGTEFGLHVSVDGGTHWTKWTHGLPTAPYRAAIVHPRDDDLVLGTHGRAAYVLDDIRPLRALAGAPEIAPTALHLFDPPDAYQHTRADAMMGGYRSSGDAMFGGENRAYGAMLSFWVGADDAGTAEITIADAAGEPVRRLSHPTTRGVNRLMWDLAHRRFATPGTRSNGTTAGPEVWAGTYEVTVTLGEHAARGTLEVHHDGRHHLSVEERRAKYDARMQVGRHMELAAEIMNRLRIGRRSIQAAIDQLTESRATVDSGRVVLGQLDNITRRLVGSATPDRTAPPPLGSLLQSAYRSMGSSWDAPTGTQTMVIRQAEEGLRTVVADFNAFATGTLPTFARHAETAGADPLGRMEGLTMEWKNPPND